jgi:hypothetical protein
VFVPSLSGQVFDPRILTNNKLNQKGGALQCLPYKHALHCAGRSPKESAPGYEEIQQIKKDTPPFDTHAPAGSVVLWHTKILHMAGHNLTTDSMRVGAIYAFAKTPQALSVRMRETPPFFSVFVPFVPGLSWPIIVDHTYRGYFIGINKRAVFCRLRRR